MSDGLDLAAIRARASAATPGPWAWGGRDFTGKAYVTEGGDDQATVAGHLDDRDAAHIAGMDPATTLALVDELERLRRWKSEAVEVILGLQDLGSALGLPLGERITGEAAAARAAALVAEVEMLRAAR